MRSCSTGPGNGSASTTTDDSGFAGLIAGLLRDGAIDERGRERYRHRLDVAGEPIHYVAIAGVKPAR